MTTATTRPMTGQEYLESLRDGREIWLYGERVDDVTTHPAFRNTARMIARLYDALHDPDHEGRPHHRDRHRLRRLHPPLLPRADDRRGAARRAATPSPPGPASPTAGWGARPTTRPPSSPPSAPTPSSTSRTSQRPRLVQAGAGAGALPQPRHHPPAGRPRPPDPRARRSLRPRRRREADDGIVVSGAKVVATGSALTHATFVAHNGLIPVQDKQYACIFMVPMNAPGVKLISRASYENTAAVMGTPFDYPLSSRLDENDAIFVLDNVFIPWEDVFVYGDVDARQQLLPADRLPAARPAARLHPPGRQAGVHRRADDEGAGGDRHRRTTAASRSAPARSSPTATCSGACPRRWRATPRPG